MPVYNFECLDCKNGYEDFTRAFDPSEVYSDIKCPSCGSFSKRKTPSLPARAILTEKTGSSKMDNFGYRAGYNMEKAQDCRRYAEANSHVGASPYSQIDDIQSGKHFGEVK